MNTTQPAQLDRRSFIKVTALAGGGVIIGMHAPDLFAQGGPGQGAQSAWSLEPSTYLTVHPDNTFSRRTRRPARASATRCR